jgi:hypothetical protein
MVRPERFELPTYSSGGCRSIQLSYGRALQVYNVGATCLNGRVSRRSPQHPPTFQKRSAW